MVYNRERLYYQIRVLEQFRQSHLKVFRKIKKNTFRILRRKRSILRYRAHLKAGRLIRKEKDNLCSIISAINIIDEEPMDCRQSIPPVEPPIRQIAEWQKQHEISYWKSQALALQYENQQDYKHPEHKKRSDAGRRTEKQQCAPPTNQERIEREDTMKELYGDKGPKISAMETALKFSYDLYKTKHDPPLWPNIPIRL